MLIAKVKGGERGKSCRSTTAIQAEGGEMP